MQEQDNTSLKEYRLNNTLYKVGSVFKTDEKTEPLEDKIKRLILNDKDSKHTVA